MAEINDLVNKIGNANHEIAQASQDLAKQLEAAKVEIGRIDVKKKELDKLNKELADVAEKLDAAKKAKAEVDQYLAKAKAALP